MQDKNKNIYIIVPAYNEAKNIAQVITDLLKYNYQIVMVDDCSTDQTFALASQYPIRVLRHQINLGQGAALATGTQYALKQGAQIIVHFDGDGQFLVSQIERVITPILSREIDIVLGSRFHTDKHRLNTQINTDSHIPFLKKYIILPLAKIINYFFTGLKLTDAHCGFRAMNRLAAEKIKITQNGMSHNTEIVAKIKKYNLKYKEIPVTVIYREFGQGIGGGVKILKELLLAKLVK